MWSMFSIITKLKASRRKYFDKKFLKVITTDKFIWIFGVSMILLSFSINFKFNNRTHYTLPQEFGMNILKNLPKNSILFTVGDQDSSITNYLQLVEGYRKDIILLPSNSFLDQWRMNRLKEDYPGFYIPDFNIDLPVSVDQYQEYVNSFFENNIKTHDIFLIEKSVVGIPDNYEVIPAGAIWKVVKNNEPIYLGYWDYQFSNPNRYKFPEKNKSSEKIRDSAGSITGVKRVMYSDESKNFELQAYKNLADICFDSYKSGKALLVKDDNGVLEAYLTGQLLFCARDNYEKMLTIDPDFFRDDIWSRRREVYQDLGDNEKARQLEIDAAVRGNKLKI